jgi:hypothetical protein
MRNPEGLPGDTCRDIEEVRKIGIRSQICDTLRVETAQDSLCHCYQLVTTVKGAIRTGFFKVLLRSGRRTAKGNFDMCFRKYRCLVN